jgi:hypothetical protein
MRRGNTTLKNREKNREQKQKSHILRASTAKCMIVTSYPNIPNCFSSVPSNGWGQCHTFTNVMNFRHKTKDSAMRLGSSPKHKHESSDQAKLRRKRRKGEKTRKEEDGEHFEQLSTSIHIYEIPEKSPRHLEGNTAMSGVKTLQESLTKCQTIVFIR